MKLNKILIGSFLAGIITLGSCSTTKSTSANYTQKTECIRTELDGTHSLRAWGNGKDKRSAIENAKRNALSDVIFKGITEGKIACNLNPLLLAVNAQLKNEVYFNTFFAKNGSYNDFISATKELKSFTVKVDQSVTYGIEVRILLPILKQKLISDGILKN